MDHIQLRHSANRSAATLAGEQHFFRNSIELHAAKALKSTDAPIKSGMRYDIFGTSARQVMKHTEVKLALCVYGSPSADLWMGH